MSNDKEIDLAKLADEESVVAEVGFPDYGLTENPFPSSAIAMRTRLFFSFGNKFRLNTFEDIGRRIVHTARAGRYRGMVILGDFGLGKTHTLYYFSEQINKQLGDKKDVKSLAIYLNSPGASLHDLLSGFLQEVGLDILLSSIFDAKKDVIVKAATECLEENVAKAKTSFEQQTQQTSQYYPQYSHPDPKERIAEYDSLRQKCEDARKTGCDLNTLVNLVHSAAFFYYPYGVGAEVIRKTTDILVKEKVFTLRDYAFCSSTLMFSSSPDTRRIATRYLLGEKLVSNEVRMVGLSSGQISTSDISKRVFPDILRVLHEFGEMYNMIFVFIDEFEKIVLGLKGAKRFEFLEDLRSLIDYNLNQFSLVLGCSTEAFETIRGTSPAFADRNRDVIDLPRITTIEEIKNLLASYMMEKRVPNFEGSIAHPFTDGALSLVIENEKGSPRYILEACHKLLNYGLRMNSKIVDETVLKSWYGK